MNSTTPHESVDIELTVNGAHHALVQIPARTSLADLLRDRLGLTGTHLGCEHGVCGACTVLVDGAPARSCITLAAACQGADIRTVEGLTDPTSEVIRQAFSEEHGLQCGFCTPGMLITARDVIARSGPVDSARAREELAGNICRCTGYAGIVRALVNASSRVSGGAA